MDKRETWEYIQREMKEVADFLLEAKKQGLGIHNVRIVPIDSVQPRNGNE